MQRISLRRMQEVWEEKLKRLHGKRKKMVNYCTFSTYKFTILLEQQIAYQRPSLSDKMRVNYYNNKIQQRTKFKKETEQQKQQNYN